jgi:hypothetical protein
MQDNLAEKVEEENLEGILEEVKEITVDEQEVKKITVDE